MRVKFRSELSESQTYILVYTTKLTCIAAITKKVDKAVEINGSLGGKVNMYIHLGY